MRKKIVFRIWAYLLKKAGGETADRIESELLGVFRRLASVPGIGHQRPDLTSADVRFFALYQYMVVYRISAPVQIVAVLHAKRDIKPLLDARV